MALSLTDALEMRSKIMETAKARERAFSALSKNEREKQ